VKNRRSGGGDDVAGDFVERAALDAGAGGLDRGGLGAADDLVRLFRAGGRFADGVGAGQVVVEPSWTITLSTTIVSPSCKRRLPVGLCGTAIRPDWIMGSTKRPSAAKRACS